MLLRPGVLFVLLIAAGAQEQECKVRHLRIECHLAGWLKILYEEFFEEYKQRNPKDPQGLIWNVTMSDLAQREAKVRGSIVKKDQPFFDNGTPYIMLQNAKAFWKADNLTVKEKVTRTIRSNTFIGWADYGKVNRLSDGAQFGCNGYGGFERLDKEYMNVVCFFEKGWQ